MGSGGISNSQSQLQGVAGQQQANANILSGEGQGLVQQGQANQAPLQSFLQSIIGGNSVTTNQALAPVIGNIAKSTNATQENIYDTTSPGAARDVLLGQNQLNQGTQVAGATNQTFLSAFPELAQLGGSQIGAGTGLTGQGITSLGNSAQTTGSVLNSQEQQKASTMQLISGLASTAGGIATGFSGGGGGAPALPTYNYVPNGISQMGL